MEDKKTILVVEDEMPLLGAITGKLELENFSTLKARSVDEARERLSGAGEISAIWLDHYLLGKGDGLDFIRGLKESEKTKDIPVFVISNTASPDKKDVYISLGIKKYYTKADHKLEDIIGDIKKTLENE